MQSLVPDFDVNTPATTLTNSKILDKEFSLGSVIVTEFNETGPQFGKIKNIFYCNDNTYFHVEIFHTSHFDKYYHAYEVITQSSLSYKFLNVHNFTRLNVPRPCFLIQKYDKELVATRFDL